MSAMDDDNLIKITHYVNPHMFWYKYESSFFTNTVIFEIENSLQKHFMKLSSITHYEPHIDEVVAVLNLAFNRWIRAKCDYISEYTTAKTKYILWAIDYGTPFQTESRWIRKLPKELENKPMDSVFFGGLSNIVPAEKIFNFDQYRPEIIPASSWSPLAVRTIENLINDAAHVKFIRDMKNKEGQYFGRLVVTTHTNNLLKADVILVEINQATTTNDFFKVLRHIGTNRIPRWQTNDGNSFVAKYNATKISEKLKYAVPLKNSGQMKYEVPESEIALEVERKVTDWEKRNQQSRMKEDISIDDISFNDSASVQIRSTGRRITDEQLEVEEDDKEEENQHLMMAGTSRRKLLEKYQKNLPRLPLDKHPDEVPSPCVEKIETIISRPSLDEYPKHIPPPPYEEVEKILPCSPLDNHSKRTSRSREKIETSTPIQTPDKNPTEKIQTTKSRSSDVDSKSSDVQSTEHKLPIEKQAEATSPVSLSPSADEKSKTTGSLDKSVGSNDDVIIANAVNVVANRFSTRRKNLSAKFKIEMESKVSEEVEKKAHTKVDNAQNSDCKIPQIDVPQNTANAVPPNAANTVPQNGPNKVPRTAIPAGFDLRHLQAKKAEIEEKEQRYNSSVERQYKSNSYNNSFGTNFSDLAKQNRNKASLNNVEEQCMQSNLSKHLALVHGKHIAKPIDKLASANFCEEVHRELENMRLTQIYRIQSYTWPHLMRGNSLIVVSSPRTGKTMSYLPAICSLIKMKSDEDLVPNSVGPIGIIVAPSSVEVERIAKLCRRFLNSSTTKMSIVESYGIRNTEKTTAQLLNGCEILVATPPSLTRLFANKLKLFDSKRIQHLVLDNIEFMHEKMKHDLHEILRKCCHLTKSNATTGVQLIVTAKYWNSMLSGFLKICHNPQLCIGAYIEAMVYARSLISMKFIQKKSKAQEIADFIKDHPYLSERLIIVCNKDEDVDEVVHALKSLSYFFIACCSRSTSTEIELSREWHIRPCGDMSILVCTDDVLPELRVSTAQNIIHYSLPLSWTKFSFRFSALFDYFEDLVKSDIMLNAPAACLILLDENNNTQLPKLIQFLCTHKSENIPTEVYDLCNKIKVQREEERRLENKEFCPFVMDFGKCLSTDDCKFRHELTSFDLPDENFPINGTIKFKVLHVASPTHYTVRLLEHKPLNEKKWKKVQNSNDYVKFNLKFSQYFSNVENHQTHWPVEVNDMCVVIDMNSYYRCRVLYVSKSRNKNIVSDMNIRVKLVDIGRDLMCKSSRILVLPKLFQDYPHQAVNLRLAGVVPYDHEQEWDSHAIHTIQHWLRKHTTDNIHIESKIKFTLMDTIWVENIDLIEKLPAILTYVKVINIKKSLLEKLFASISTEAEESLKELASNCGILKDFEATCTASTSTPIKNDCDIAVEKSSSTNEGSVCSSISSLSAQYKITNNYTLLETSNTTNSKQSSSSSNVNNSLKQTTTKTSSNNKKPIKTNETKVPAVKELWENLVENRACRISVATFYSPNNFYVQHLANLERQEELYNAIDRYVAKNRLIVTDPKIGLNCLAKYEGKYNRAKITKVLCDGESTELNVSLFFCDIGISENMSLSKVLYSSDNLVSMLPFQAIRCKLIGVMPNKYGVWTDDISDKIYDEIIDQSHFLYARAVKFEEPNKQSDLQYWKCDVILIDCSTAMDIKINENIVEKGLAQFDPETSHFLGMVLNIISSDESDDSSDNNWDDCNYIRSIVPKLNQSLELEDLNMVDIDVEFSQDDILQLLNLPPTAKILPPEPPLREQAKPHPRITELNDQSSKSKSVENQIDERTKPKHNENKVLDLNDNITELGRDEYNGMPPLLSLYKTPQVIWQQSESLIYLHISTPDITDYYLKVTSTCLIFIAKIDGDTKMLQINFCGCIHANLVSHEIRGLKVIVRLPKAIKGLPWPRLTFDSDKPGWLKYNYDSIVVEQEILPNTSRYPFDSYIMDYSSDSESDRDEPIYDMQINDEFDPLEDDFNN